MTEYALRIISGKYQGGQFKIKDDRDITVGRSSDAEMVLVEDMVSRYHSRITSRAGVLAIVDLGSTNGTFVNGERVGKSPVELKEGDRILIGTSVLKIIAIEETAAEIEDSQEKDSGPNSRRSTMSITRHMSGSIDEIPLPDLLQLLSTSRKSGVLSVHSSPMEGRIYLRNGKVYYCSLNDNFDLDPSKAFYRLITWTSGTFDLLPPDDTEFLNEIKDGTESLLMEGMRIFDEINRLKKDLPPADSKISLAVNITKPLRDLNPSQLDVLQLVHNHGKSKTILDRSTLSDLDVYEILLMLKENQYIQFS
ncbi:DUF4388 domain-containing protein [Myxococcota bacterium]|nr:DUF4388 domain-containing protein [Myxococcota bacterium]